MKTCNRRQALKLTGGVAAIIPLQMISVRGALASDLPQVNPQEGTANALAYVHASENPEQLCENCQLYTGVSSEQWGPCAIFPGQSVNAKGWCKSWIRKSS